LSPDDVLLRVLEPEWWDESGPLAVGFEDLGKPYESLSFFVARMATPMEGMAQLAIWGRAKKLCGSGRRPPTPEEMYQRGYRVSRTPARFVLEMIEATACEDPGKRVRIKPEADGEIRTDGHINLHNGKHYCQLLAAQSHLLTQDETLGPR
jgi:hypothetical protein